MAVDRDGKNCIAIVNEICQRKFGTGFTIIFKKTENTVKDGKNVAVSTVRIKLPDGNTFEGIGRSVPHAKEIACGDALDFIDERYQYYDPVF